MAFKDSKSFSDAKKNFTNEMARFVSNEASFFSSEDHEAASANVDAAFEKAVTYSAGKNAEKAKQHKKELRKLKASIKKDSKELKASEKRLEVGKQNIQTRKNEQFVKSETARITDNRKEVNKKLDKKKEHKKKSNNAKKKQTAKLSVANMLRSKKNLSDEAAGGGANTGDAFQDGKSGLVGKVLEVVNPMHYLKALMAKLAALLAPYILLFMTVAIIMVIMVALIFNVLQPLVAIGDAISDFLSGFSSEEKTFVTSSLTEDEINQIIADAACNENEKKVLRYVLSKVGYPYSQAYRCSGNYYDCSSLAYYAWDDAGVDISFGSRYPPTAAEGARLLKNNGKSVASGEGVEFSLKPGDLVYYGGSDNGRYLGIYHVAIYVGNGKAVEALNEKYGVVYQNINVKDAIMVCRPNL